MRTNEEVYRIYRDPAKRHGFKSKNVVVVESMEEERTAKRGRNPGRSPRRRWDAVIANFKGKYITKCNIKA